MIGEVSAGILEKQVSDQLLHELPSLLLYFAAALAIGVVASVTLARRLKRSTFGLELEEIAALVQEREAMLHGIREGVITLDRDGRVTLINDEARRLIPLDGDPVGRSIDEVVSHRRLSDLLTGALGGPDTVVVTDEHILSVNRMPVFWNERDLGAVVTLRDRTELEGLLRELDSVDALTDALRAQQHEFANRMHTVAGLIELGDQQAAIRYALEVSGETAGLAEAIRERIEAPEIAALLIAKTTVAAERDVELVLSEDSQLARTGIGTNMLLSIIGNLIDNAIDAAATGPGPARVTVRLVTCEEKVTLEVTDTGPGVPEELGHESSATGSRPNRTTSAVTAESGWRSCTGSRPGPAAPSPSTARAPQRSRSCSRPGQGAASRWARDQHADRRGRLPRGHDPRGLRAQDPRLQRCGPRLDRRQRPERDQAAGADACPARPLPPRRPRTRSRARRPLAARVTGRTSWSSRPPATWAASVPPCSSGLCITSSSRSRSPNSKSG